MGFRSILQRLNDICPRYFATRCTFRNLSQPVVRGKMTDWNLLKYPITKRPIDGFLQKMSSVSLHKFAPRLQLFAWVGWHVAVMEIFHISLGMPYCYRLSCKRFFFEMLSWSKKLNTFRRHMIILCLIYLHAK